MSRRTKFFQLLAGKDIDSNEMDFGVAVLSSLGGRHVDNLAGAILDHNETVLAESGTLHGKCGGGASIGALEGVLMLLFGTVRHFEKSWVIGL